MTRRPDPDTYLTVWDVPSDALPHGTASLVTVERYSEDGLDVTVAECVIDQRGFLRTREGEYVPRDFEVVE